MKTRYVHLHALLLTVFTTTGAMAARDPFWPLGYAPAPPPPPQAPVAEVVREVAPAVPKPPPPPAVKPVTEDEWAKAYKALKFNGFTRSVTPGTLKTNTLAMINFQTYSVGDAVTVMQDNVRFTWRVDAILESDTRLVPVQAERLEPKPMGDKLKR